VAKSSFWRRWSGRAGGGSERWGGHPNFKVVIGDLDIAGANALAAHLGRQGSTLQFDALQPESVRQPFRAATWSECVGPSIRVKPILRPCWQPDHSWTSMDDVDVTLDVLSWTRGKAKRGDGAHGDGEFTGRDHLLAKLAAENYRRDGSVDIYHTHGGEPIEAKASSSTASIACPLTSHVPGWRAQVCQITFEESGIALRTILIFPSWASTVYPYPHRSR